MISSFIKKKINQHQYFASKFIINDIMMFNSRNIKTIKSNKSFNHKNLESFKIIKIYDNLIYELKLSTSIKRLHFVFHS